MTERIETYEELKSFARDKFPLRGPNSEVDHAVDLANHGKIESAYIKLAEMQCKDKIFSQDAVSSEFVYLDVIEVNESNKLDILSQAFLLGLEQGRKEGAEVVEDWKDFLVPASNKDDMAEALEDNYSLQNRILDNISYEISSKAIKEVEIYGGSIVRFILKHKKINGYDTASQYTYSAIREFAKDELINSLVKLGFSNVPFKDSDKDTTEPLK